MESPWPFLGPTRFVTADEVAILAWRPPGRADAPSFARPQSPFAILEADSAWRAMTVATQPVGHHEQEDPPNRHHGLLFST